MNAAFTPQGSDRKHMFVGLAWILHWRRTRPTTGAGATPVGAGVHPVAWGGRAATAEEAARRDPAPGPQDWRPFPGLPWATCGPSHSSAIPTWPVLDVNIPQERDPIPRHHAWPVHQILNSFVCAHDGLQGSDALFATFLGNYASH